MSNRFSYTTFALLTAMVLVLVVLPVQSPGCSAFCLKTENHLFLGKNLDWRIGHGFLIINRNGEKKTAFLLSGDTPLSWVSVYGSITFNQLGKDFPLGGMNEKGLVIEELSYSPSRYPPPAQLPAVNEFQWIQYHLDTSACVDDIVKKLASVKISPFLFPLHFILADSSGDAAVIEFLDGRIEVFRKETLPVPVLTNNSYENALKYLELMKGQKRNRPGIDRNESPQRFLRLAEALAGKNQIPEHRLIDRSFELLNSVRQADTQWSIVYDLIHKNVYFTTRNHRTVKSLKLRDCNFSGRVLPLYVDLDEEVSVLKIKHFKTLTSKENRVLLEKVFSLLSLYEKDPRLGEYPQRITLHLFRQPMLQNNGKNGNKEPR